MIKNLIKPAIILLVVLWGTWIAFKWTVMRVYVPPGKALKVLAEKTQIPVAWTLLGIGVIDERHPLAYGYMGLHGW